MSDPQLPPSGTVANSAEELIAGGKVMSIWDHLSELRSRVTRALADGVCLIWTGSSLCRSHH